MCRPVESSAPQTRSSRRLARRNSPETRPPDPANFRQASPHPNPEASFYLSSGRWITSKGVACIAATARRCRRAIESPGLRAYIRKLLRGARPRRAGQAADYKSVWNSAARTDAREAILTGSTPERFEETGAGDAERLRPYLRGGDVVLNIGCGVGRVERYLAPLVAQLWAVDISGEMIAQARERLRGLSNVHLREVSNDEFLRSFDSQSFDLVFSFLVLQHLDKEDAARYLQDARRVLKPGGVFVGQFPNHLSPEYTRAFLAGLDLRTRSAGRVRTYTDTEVRHTLEALGYRVMDLHFSAGVDWSPEIYVAAGKPGDDSDSRPRPGGRPA